MGTLQALQALRVVNHHGQHGDFGRRTCAKGPRHLMPQFQTALGDLPADLICHILALLPIADRWLRQPATNLDRSMTGRAQPSHMNARRPGLLATPSDGALREAV